MATKFYAVETNKGERDEFGDLVFKREIMSTWEGALSKMEMYSRQRVYQVIVVQTAWKR